MNIMQWLRRPNETINYHSSRGFSLSATVPILLLAIYIGLMFGKDGLLPMIKIASLALLFNVCGYLQAIIGKRHDTVLGLEFFQSQQRATVHVSLAVLFVMAIFAVVHTLVYGSAT